MGASRPVTPERMVRAGEGGRQRDGRVRGTDGRREGCSKHAVSQRCCPFFEALLSHERVSLLALHYILHQQTHRHIQDFSILAEPPCTCHMHICSVFFLCMNVYIYSVCMYVCMYECARVYVFMYECVHFMHVCMHAYMHACIYVLYAWMMYTCMHARVSTYPNLYKTCAYSFRDT